MCKQQILASVSTMPVPSDLLHVEGQRDPFLEQHELLLTHIISMSKQKVIVSVSTMPVPYDLLPVEEQRDPCHETLITFVYIS